jgi:hypothetical protein
MSSPAVDLASLHEARRARREAAAPPAPPAAAPAAAAPPAAPARAALQVRLPGGAAPLRFDLPASAPLAELFALLAAAGFEASTPGGAHALWSCDFPRRRLEAADAPRALAALGLAPRAALLVEPRARAPAPGAPAFRAGDLGGARGAARAAGWAGADAARRLAAALPSVHVAALLALAAWLAHCWFMPLRARALAAAAAAAFFAAKAAEARAGAAARAAAAARLTARRHDAAGGVRTLRDGAEEAAAAADEDRPGQNAYWNGNSTEFEGDGADAGGDEKDD